MEHGNIKQGAGCFFYEKLLTNPQDARFSYKNILQMMNKSNMTLLITILKHFVSFPNEAIENLQ